MFFFPFRDKSHHYRSVKFVGFYFYEDDHNHLNSVTTVENDVSCLLHFRKKQGQWTST